jgi:hypothetical protein
VSPLEAGIARELVDFGHIGFLAAGGDWDELRWWTQAGWPHWRYRIFKSGVKVTASPHGSGWVPWSRLQAIVTAGLSEQRSRRALALARIDWTDPRHLPDRLRKAGLAPDAEPSEVREAKDAVVREVLDAGIATTGGLQLDLFGGGAA